MSPKRFSAKKSRSHSPFPLKIISHQAFFFGVIVLFVIQAVWIALSALYPMLFDEELHVGIIEIYSRQLSPFITHQPPEAAFHGDITRMGSYLFHYLMSFPYRLVSVFTNDLTTHIIVLRLVCIGFFVGGLLLFNKLLQLAKISASLRHLVILFFTLIPLVPFTAAQVNYDSLVFLLVPTLFYMTLKATRRTDRQALWILLAVSTGLLASLVKFSVLPIFLGVVVFIAIVLWRQHHKRLPLVLWRQLVAAPRLLVLGAAVFMLLATGLFVERYGTNVIMYHSLDPSCGQIHSKEECLQYNVARRTYEWSEDYQKHPHPLMNPAMYTVSYFIPHIFNDFFITAAYTGGEIGLRQPLGKLEASGGSLFLRVVGWGVFVFGTLFTVFTWRQVKYRQLRYLFLLTGGIYVLALWIKIYGSYQSLGTPVAAQGRYMIPFLIPAFVMVALALSHTIRRTKTKLIVSALALLVFTQGGGAMTYALYSKPSWYWPNQTVVKINQSTRQVLKLFTF